MKNLSNYTLISFDTPLISNLNMLENIALIKEFHEHKPTSKAQAEALEYLELINIQNIALNRLTQCNDIEIFYIKFIRAMMTSEKQIIIISKVTIDSSTIIDIETIIDNMLILNNLDKNILILDIEQNEIIYKDSTCNTVK